VHGEEARLDQEGARDAHRVDEGLIAGEADGAEDGGGERLLERGHGRPDAVAALVQRCAGDVEREREPGPGQMGHDAHVGPAGVHVGTAAALAAEAVHEGVLDLQRHEPGMGVLRVAQRGLDGERRLRVEMLLPGDLVRRVIEALRAVRLGLGEGPEQAHGDARPGAMRSASWRLARKRTPPRRRGPGRRRARELLGEEVLGSAGGGGEEGQAPGHRQAA
jgi:hypothetical protein